jgi:hypothetical protein
MASVRVFAGSLVMSVTPGPAIGSIGTAIAAVVAVLTLLALGRQSREGEAARIRERLRRFKTQLIRGAALLESGRPLIAAAWYTALTLRSRLGDPATGEDLRKALSDEATVLSASVIGWASSPATDELTAALNQLVAEQEFLSGDLNLVSSAGALVLGIADDGYSPVLFTRALSEEPLAIFLRENSQIQDVEALTRSVAGHVQSNAAAYFEIRYGEALRSIREFVGIAARAIGDLDSQTLVKLARARARLNEGGDTYTGDMLAELEHVRTYLGGDDVQRLGELIREIELLVSKDRFHNE